MKFIHTTITVKDMEESLKFYEKIVGLTVDRRFKAGPNSEIVFLGEGDTKVELICHGTDKDINIGEDISLGFEVNSVEEKMAFLKENGVAIHSGPFQPNPQVKFIYVQDPNGLKIQFLENIR